mgnify:CR=1 FL=1
MQPDVRLTNTNYLRKDDVPSQNYNVVLDGTITQVGILAVQPSATTALIMRGMDLRLVGTVYDPPLEIDESGCALEMTQSGSDVAGNACAHGGVQVLKEADRFAHDDSPPSVGWGT